MHPSSQLKNSYRELVALTQLFLLTENHPKNKVITDPETYQFFRNWAKANPLPNPLSKTTPNSKSSVITKPELQLDNLPSPIDPTPSQPKPEFPPKNPTPPKQAPPKPQQPNPLPTHQPELQPAPRTPERTPKQPPPSTPEVSDSLALEKKSVSSGFRSFQLEPPPSPTVTDLNDIKSLFKEKFTNFPICEQIPSDHQAKNIKNAWQIELIIPPIVILSFNEQDKHLAFLKNVSKAISLYLAPARVLSGPAWEQEKRWNELLKARDLRLVIASDYGLYLLPTLMKSYKEEPKTAKHFLDQVPLLLLSDISLYLKEPQLKPLLWRAICTEFEIARKRIVKS